MNPKDFFTVCENTNENIPDEKCVVNIKLIGKFGLEIGFDLEFVSRTVTRLGDLDGKVINPPSFNFSSQRILKLRKIKNISPKIRLYFEAGFPMMMVAQTSLGPLKFFVKGCLVVKFTMRNSL